jgi:hypothetical protein
MHGLVWSKRRDSISLGADANLPYGLPEACTRARPRSDSSALQEADQERAVDLELAVVIDEAERSEFVQKEIAPRAFSARSSGSRGPAWSACQNLFDADVARQHVCDEHVGHRRLLMQQPNHHVTADEQDHARHARRRGPRAEPWPARHPSPKKSPGPSTASLPSFDCTDSLTPPD